MLEFWVGWETNRVYSNWRGDHTRGMGGPQGGPWTGGAGEGPTLGAQGAQEP
jgi:hypothetical protein